MAAYDFTAPRLYLDAPLAACARLPLERAQANYLLNVLRLREGEFWSSTGAMGSGWRGLS
jgi:16S rRNA (uracil1498-N3)-methyltransferase